MNHESIEGAGGSDEGIEVEHQRPVHFFIVERHPEMARAYAEVIKLYGHQGSFFSTVEDLNDTLQQNIIPHVIVSAEMRGRCFEVISLARQYNVLPVVIGLDSAMLEEVEQREVTAIDQGEPDTILDFFRNIHTTLDIFRQSLDGPAAQE